MTGWKPVPPQEPDEDRNSESCATKEMRGCAARPHTVFSNFSIAAIKAFTDSIDTAL